MPPRAAPRLAPALGLLALALLPAAACRSSDVLGNLGGGAVSAAGGDRRLGDVARVATGSAVEHTQQLSVQFTPEQEYYLGRGVAATAIARHGLDPDEALQAYVRTVGHALVAVSSRLPDTFGGYTFGVLATSDVNAVSGPGGFVLVTRGAVEACASEDELAAILAHELAHVSLKHGESTLRQGRSFGSSLGALARVAAAAAGANEQGYAAGLVSFFGQAVGDASRTAMEHAYGRDAEFAADREAVYVLYDAGYDGAAMSAVLAAIEARHGYGGEAHAAPADRRAAIERFAAEYGGFQDPAGQVARDARFRRALGRG